MADDYFPDEFDTIFGYRSELLYWNDYFEEEEEEVETEVEREEDDGRESESRSGEDMHESDHGLCCPICMDAWTNEGDHQICCLPCGHLYGLSCVTKWLTLKQPTQCPTCKRKCALKDVRKLFTSQIVAVDDKLQKKIRSLEEKCDLLQTQNTALESIESDSRKIEVALESSSRMLEDINRKVDLMVKMTFQILAEAPEKSKKMQDRILMAKRLAEFATGLAQEESKLADQYSLLKK